MATSNDPLIELQSLAASPARRILPAEAAKYLNRSLRTLEEWRRTWRQTDATQTPPLRRGPKFYKFGKRVLYEVRDLDEFLAARRAQSRTGSDLTRYRPSDTTSSQ